MHPWIVSDPKDPKDPKNGQATDDGEINRDRISSEFQGEFASQVHLGDISLFSPAQSTSKVPASRSNCFPWWRSWRHRRWALAYGCLWQRVSTILGGESNTNLGFQVAMFAFQKGCCWWLMFPCESKSLGGSDFLNDRLTRDELRYCTQNEESTQNLLDFFKCIFWCWPSASESKKLKWHAWGKPKNPRSRMTRGSFCLAWNRHPLGACRVTGRPAAKRCHCCFLRRDLWGKNQPWSAKAGCANYIVVVK